MPDIRSRKETLNGTSSVSQITCKLGSHQSGFLLFAIIAVLQWVIISFMRDIKLEIKHVRAEYGLRIHGAELAIEALRTRQEVESGVDR